MFAEERREEIKELIEANGSMAVQDLSAEFDVSGSTIRRDLKELEEAGLIKRTHGGAVIDQNKAKFEPSFIDKEKENFAAKKTIGSKAGEFIADGDTIIIDAGTTTINLVDSLANYDDLTIITNSINAARRLSDSKHEVILIGGRLKKKTQAMVGSFAKRNLSKINADKAFLGTNGIDLNAGLTTPDMIEAEVKEMMIKKANEVFVLADYTKFEQITFSTITTLDRIDYIITDNNLSAEILKNYKKEIEIIVAEEVRG